MRPACQPPPIRHKKLNHDAIAMASFFQRTASVQLVQTALVSAYLTRRRVYRCKFTHGSLLTAQDTPYWSVARFEQQV
jgi:hypothetical protein